MMGVTGQNEKLYATAIFGVVKCKFTLVLFSIPSCGGSGSGG
jgi:hypothetical protein